MSWKGKTWKTGKQMVNSGVPRNFVRGSSTNSVEDRGRQKGELQAAAPSSGVLEAAFISYKKFHFI